MHVIVSLLKAWKVSVVWIDATMPSFNAISRWYTPKIVSSRKNLNSASKVANFDFSRYSQVFFIGRAKRAPHWGVQPRFRVIYVGMSHMSN